LAIEKEKLKRFVKLIERTKIYKLYKVNILGNYGYSYIPVWTFGYQRSVKTQRDKVNYRLGKRSGIFCGEEKAVFNWINTQRQPKCFRGEHRQQILRSIAMEEN
jgi:hypothetical protein